MNHESACDLPVGTSLTNVCHCKNISGMVCWTFKKIKPFRTNVKQRLNRETFMAQFCSASLGVYVSGVWVVVQMSFPSAPRDRSSQSLWFTISLLATHGFHSANRFGQLAADGFHVLHTSSWETVLSKASLLISFSLCSVCINMYICKNATTVMLSKLISPSGGTQRLKTQMSHLKAKTINATQKG